MKHKRKVSDFNLRIQYKKSELFQGILKSKKAISQ